MSVFVFMQSKTQLCLLELNEQRDAQFMWQLIHVPHVLKWLYRLELNVLCIMKTMTQN